LKINIRCSCKISILKILTQKKECAFKVHITILLVCADRYFSCHDWQICYCIEYIALVNTILTAWLSSWWT